MKKPSPVPWLSRLALYLLLVTLLGGCDLFAGSEQQSILETQLEINVQQTLRAEEAEQLSRSAEETLQAQQATLTARVKEGTQAPPAVDFAAQTANAQQATQAAEQTSRAVEAAVTPQPPQADFQTWMQSAKIVVYEDITNDTTEYRYVEKTLQGMGLTFKWDGSAKGWFKNDLLGGAPGGGPWDLVILAVEVRGEVSGEYFDYVNEALNRGSSVIIEAWHLDEISRGTVSTILTNCGVGVSDYIPRTGTTFDVVVWPLAGASSHPLLTEPNSGLSFTKARDKWIPSGDLGDLLHLTGSGDAQLLMGTDATETSRNGVLAVCMGGQLVLQTFSSHSFPYDVMQPLWENMITFALKTRFSR